MLDGVLIIDASYGDKFKTERSSAPRRELILQLFLRYQRSQRSRWKINSQHEIGRSRHEIKSGCTYSDLTDISRGQPRVHRGSRVSGEGSRIVLSLTYPRIGRGYISLNERRLWRSVNLLLSTLLMQLQDRPLSRWSGRQQYLLSPRALTLGVQVIVWIGG
jgi:hypothetical protein